MSESPKDRKNIWKKKIAFRLDNFDLKFSIFHLLRGKGGTRKYFIAKTKKYCRSQLPEKFCDLIKMQFQIASFHVVSKLSFKCFVLLVKMG